MIDAAMTTAGEPDGAPRNIHLDVLRGVAILGILFMNINDMGQSLWASFVDIRHLGWSATDQIAWWLREVLANGTARAMLEMLFGAGMVILTDRAAESARYVQVMGRYFLRNLILFAFGLVHVFILLWPGDILHTYGLAAMVAFLFVHLETRALMAIGLSLAAYTFASGAYSTYAETTRLADVAAVVASQRAGQALTVRDRTILLEDRKLTAAQAKAKAEVRHHVAQEDASRKGTFRSWASVQWGIFLWMQDQLIEFMLVWEAAATMLIGAALFRLGVLQGQRTPRFYRNLMLASYAIAIAMRAVAAWEATRFDDMPGTGEATAEIARLLMAAGHVGAINLLLGTAIGKKLLRPFVAAGRTALTIYICQTLITLWLLFPPFALGLYGRLTWGPLMIVAFVIDAALLWAANLYVRHVDIAPVEWAWRSLVARRALPWRKRPAAAA